MKTILLAALLLLTSVSGAFAYEHSDRGPSETVAQAQGLTVQLIPSGTLKSRAKGVKKEFPRYGCDYKIEWGDGLSDPRPYFPTDVHCKSKLWHEYARPGVYVIKIHLYKGGADKEGYRMLQETSTVQVFVQ